ncbi:Lhr family helicase, partial [Dokdonella sp.]|uniref:Lhr family helicase n=1 Tax=Dokdonella sp. TaxID=2291710 RepID=UPI002F4BB423
FPLDEVARYLHSNSVRDVLVQALLDAPMFGLRFRWNATTSLALPRFQGGSKVPPQLQRMKAEDLLAQVFPDQVACLENIVGERQVPEHPLVDQTLHDCLHEAMDIDALVALLQRLERGDARIVARDLTGPSPLAAEILGARPYAFLDDAPLEERRTQAVGSRRWSSPEHADDLGRLDQDAIDAVREEAWPQARGADELHAALMGVAFVTAAEARANHDWVQWLERLAADRRVARLSVGADAFVWIPAERLPQFAALLPEAPRDPAIEAPAEYAAVAWTPEDALVEILRARMTALGPAWPDAIAASLGVDRAAVELALLALERNGFVMQGRYSSDALARGDGNEWCERHVLARIHRYTVKRLRREIEPVEPRDYMRFLFDWQRVADGTRVSGPDALAGVLAQLEGYEAPASAWEGSILPARVDAYEIAWLDALCQAGRLVWTRLRPRKGGGERAGGPVRATPIVLLQRRSLDTWMALANGAGSDPAAMSSRAQVVVEHLSKHGASFFDELLAGTRLLHVQLEEALGELVASGVVHSDSFSGLRALLVPSSKRPSTARRRHGRRSALFGIEDAGRWALVRRAGAERTEAADATTVEHVARVLLRRYGVVCWRLLAHEAEWLPPWRELIRAYHRLEARGEIRGGRFIAGIAGEQFALPDAVAALRAVRQRPLDGRFVCVSGADPLNLTGGLLVGDKVPRVATARVLYRDGVPVAQRVAGVVTLADPAGPVDELALRAHLLRDRPLRSAAAAANGHEEE